MTGFVGEHGRTLALFDFDGTISRRDTLFLFLRHTHGPMAILTGMAKMAPLLAAHAAGIASAIQAKEGLLRAFYRGWYRDDLVEQGRRFADTLFRSVDALHQPVMATLKAHVDRGDHVCIASASLDLWVRPFAGYLNADVISTELEFDAKFRFTGRLEGPNVNGDEKARAIATRYRLTEFSRIVAFGNSRGDLPMLRLADEAFLVRRNGKCTRVAKKDTGSR